MADYSDKPIFTTKAQGWRRIRLGKMPSFVSFVSSWQLNLVRSWCQAELRNPERVTGIFQVSRPAMTIAIANYSGPLW